MHRIRILRRALELKYKEPNGMTQNKTVHSTNQKTLKRGKKVGKRPERKDYGNTE
jgi:hypothetical protein